MATAADNQSILDCWFIKEQEPKVPTCFKGRENRLICEEICLAEEREEGAFKTLESGRMEQGRKMLSGHFPITSWSSVLYEGPRGDGKTAEKGCVVRKTGAFAILAPGDFSSSPVTAFA